MSTFPILRSEGRVKVLEPSFTEKVCDNQRVNDESEGVKDFLKKTFFSIQSLENTAF